MDMNDRSLRHIIVMAWGGTSAGIPRETGFDITAASEVMAILCLSDDFEDLKNRLGNIFIGYTFDKKPIYARDLHAHGAMAALLKDAIKPNLVQTLEGNPGHHTWWSVRKYRPRDQLNHRNPYGINPLRLRGDRGRIRF